MADVSAGEEPMAAAATPEPDSATDPVHAVGIGPGDPAFLTGRARELLAEADAVVGFETVLDYAAEVTDEADTRHFACGYDDQTDKLDGFAAAVADGARGVAALMGDPNVSGYQFLGRVERAVDRPVRVVPGISSVQVAASRARTPLEETTVVTLHRRGSLDAPLDRLAADAGDRHLLVIPRPYDWMPEDVAAFLVERGADPALGAFVFEHLTHDAEARTTTTLGDLATEAGKDGEAGEAGESDPGDSAFSDLSVLVVRAERLRAGEGED